MFISAKIIKDHDLIERRLFDYLQEDNQIVEVNPEFLMTSNRFDVAIKLSYLRYKDVAPQLAREIYADHLIAFGGGRFYEPEKEHKNSLDAFVFDFLLIEQSIKNQGFNDGESIIPLAKDGSILNGAHRVAAAIFHGRPIKAIKLDVEPSNYGYEFFVQRHTPWNTLLLGLQEYMWRKPNVRVAIYWPKASDIVTYCPNNIIATYEAKLTLSELAGFVRQVYRGEAWLGSPANSYQGAINKASNCYTEKSTLKVVVFLAEENVDLVALKTEIRNELSLGKHSLHISDYMQDTQQVVNFIFNANSKLFLSVENSSKFPHKDKKVERVFDALLAVDGWDKTAIDSSLVLEIFGIREASDIDTISMESVENIDVFKSLGIENHNKYFIQYGLDINEIICNPLYHFYYNNVKVVSLRVLKEFKERRMENKDVNDIAMMVALENKSPWGMRMAKLRQTFFYMRFNSVRKIKSTIAYCLRKLGLFNIVKSLLGK